MSEYAAVEGQSQEKKLVFDFKKMHDVMIGQKKREEVVDDNKQQRYKDRMEIRRIIDDTLSKIKEQDGVITYFSFLDYSLEQVFMNLVANDA